MASSIDNVIKGIMPNIQRSQAGIQQWLQQNAQRQGTAGAYSRSIEAVSPYAKEAADVAGRSALSAANLDEKIREYNEQLKQRQSEFNQQQQNWQAGFDLNKALAGYNATGFLSPDLLNMFGYGDINRGDMRNLQNQLNILGINGGNNAMKNGPTVGGYNYNGVTYGPNHPMMKYI